MWNFGKQSLATVMMTRMPNLIVTTLCRLQLQLFARRTDIYLLCAKSQVWSLRLELEKSKLFLKKPGLHFQLATTLKLHKEVQET